MRCDLNMEKEKQNNNQPVQHVSQGQEKNNKNNGIPAATENHNNNQPVQPVSQPHKEIIECTRKQKENKCTIVPSWVDSCSG